MSRPKIQIDLNRVEDLAAQGLSEAEIGASLGFSQDTFSRRKRDSADFAEAFRRGRDKARAVVSSKLFELAASGNVPAIRWWEMTRLGLSDRTKSEVTVKQTFEDFVAAFATAQSGSSANSESVRANREGTQRRIVLGAN